MFFHLWGGDGAGGAKQTTTKEKKSQPEHRRVITRGQDR